MKSPDLKHIILTGLVIYLAIVAISVLSLNWFWTGAGYDTTRTIFPSFSNNADEIKDYATLLIALLSFTASLLSPIVVFLIYNAWKEQKLYDFKKEIIQDIIIIIDKHHYELIKQNSYSLSIKKVSQEGQSLSGVFDSQLSNYREEFSTVYSKINIYKKLTTVNFKSDFRYYESYFMALAKINRNILEEYKEYYNKIPFDTTPFDKSSDYSFSYSEDLPKYKFRSEITYIENLFKEKIYHSYAGEPFIQYKETYEEIIKLWKLKHDEIMENLINEINPIV